MSNGDGQGGGPLSQRQEPRQSISVQQSVENDSSQESVTVRLERELNQVLNKK